MARPWDDQSLVVVGEACDSSGAVKLRRTACTQDKKGVADCTSGAWRVRKTCTGANGCRTTDEGITCDNPVVFEDDSLKNAP